MPKAIIDLGTNTFHLIVASRASDGTINELKKVQIPVKMGMGGINQNRISDAAMKRGLEAFEVLINEVRSFDIPVSRILAIATSAIRNACNGDVFVNEVFHRFGITIRTINGDEEAAYIYTGVLHSFSFPDEPVLVMDIGGGSVEFIVGQKEEVLFRKSIEAGAARLVDLFKHDEPISQYDYDRIRHYLEEKLHPVWNMQTRPNVLIGSAGSFETLAEVCKKDLDICLESISPNVQAVPLDAFHQYVQLIKKSNPYQRKVLKGMVDFRVEMIVVATLLMELVIEKLGISRVMVSSYSLKEGIFFSH